MRKKASEENLFLEISREYHEMCMNRFRKIITGFFGVFLKYVFFGVVLWMIFYSRNTAISQSKFMVYYTILFILLAIFSFLFGVSAKKPSVFEGYELDIEDKKSVVSRILRTLVGIIAIPARGTIENFVDLGDSLFSLTKNQFIFGMRIAHTLRKEITLDFLHMIYHSIISREELNNVLSFLKNLDLVMFIPRDNRVYIRPTKKLQQLQQKYAPPSNAFPPLNEMDRLRGILSYLQERTIDGAAIQNS
jgi:hypothetical protein